MIRGLGNLATTKRATIAATTMASAKPTNPRKLDRDRGSGQVSGIRVGLSERGTRYRSTITASSAVDSRAVEGGEGAGSPIGSWILDFNSVLRLPDTASRTRCGA